MKTISIVGGGFCGCMLTLHLLRQSTSGIKIHLIEKSKNLCRGVAYSTTFNFHLLNVNAGKMSAFQSDEDHFINWLNAHNHPYTSEDYVPRKLYGDYLSDLLVQELTKHPDAVSVHSEKAIDLTLENNQATILLESGEKINSEKVVLAPGNFHPQSNNDPFGKYADEGIYFNNPWEHPTILRNISQEDNLLILGSGLTMIDLCTTLYFNGHRGTIYAFSRHGYLPAMHKPVHYYPPFYHELEQAGSLTEIVSIIKKHIRSHQKQGGDWRDVIDSLRPFNQKIWINLSTSDKLLFLKRLNRLWNITRHRIPQEYQATLNELTKTKQLELHSGKIDTIGQEGKNLMITIRHTNGTKTSFDVQRVINCTGPQLNYLKLNDPFIQNMFQKGLIHPHPLNLGLDATAEGKVKNHYDENSIYTLGSTLTGVLFESTAVPELKVQAEALAHTLIASELPVSSK